MVEHAGVAPATIGELNCEAALGWGWRFTCDTAVYLDVQMWRVRGELLIPMGPLLLAIQREAQRTEKIRSDHLAERLAGELEP